MWSAALKKKKQIHSEPRQHKKDTKNDDDGKRAPGMAEVLLAIVRVNGFR
jgi:hypothetical protein